MGNIIEQADNLMTFIQQYAYLTTFVYLLLSFIIAIIVDRIIIGIIRKLVKKTKTKLDDYLLDVFHKPIYYTILCIGFYLSIDSIGLPEKINFIFAGILKTIIVFYWISGLFKALGIIVRFDYVSTKTKLLISSKTLPLFDNVGKILIFLTGIYFIMLSWNINVTAIVASAGILSIAIGFAAKDTLGNLFAGIFIMADSPYQEGDYINLDTGERGYVTNIGLRSTRILTRDEIEITIPNSVIATTKIVNESGGPEEGERIRINVNIAYGSDLEKTKKILKDIALNSDIVCKNPSPRVRLRELAESSY